MTISVKSTKSHTGEYPKYGHSPHGYEIPQSGIMAVSVKSTSSRSCQRAFCGEVLCFTPKNAKNGRFSNGFEIPHSGIIAVSVEKGGGAM